MSYQVHNHEFDEYPEKEPQLPNLGTQVFDLASIFLDFELRFASRLTKRIVAFQFMQETTDIDPDTKVAAKIETSFEIQIIQISAASIQISFTQKEKRDTVPTTTAKAQLTIRKEEQTDLYRNLTATTEKTDILYSYDPKKGLSLPTPETIETEEYLHELYGILANHLCRELENDMIIAGKSQFSAEIRERILRYCLREIRESDRRGWYEQEINDNTFEPVIFEGIKRREKRTPFLQARREKRSKYRGSVYAEKTNYLQPLKDCFLGSTQVIKPILDQLSQGVSVSPDHIVRGIGEALKEWNEHLAQSNDGLDALRNDEIITRWSQLFEQHHPAIWGQELSLVINPKTGQYSFRAHRHLDNNDKPSHLYLEGNPKQPSIEEIYLLLNLATPV